MNSFTAPTKLGIGTVYLPNLPEARERLYDLVDFVEFLTDDLTDAVEPDETDLAKYFAILPAIFVILLYGTEGVGQLLILSQVVLSFQLPFAIVPLVMFTASRAKMGELVAPWWLTAVCWLIATVIIVLNVNLLSTVVLG